MRLAGLVIVVAACDPKPVRMPGYYPKPTPSYAQPQPAQQPRAGTQPIPRSELLGRWSYVTPNADSGVLTLDPSGSYEHGTSSQRKPGGCTQLVSSWQRGAWETAGGNAITLRPKLARDRMQDNCVDENNYDREAAAQPVSYSVQLGRDEHGTPTLTLFLANGELHSGPYARQ